MGINLDAVKSRLNKLKESSSKKKKSDEDSPYKKYVWKPTGKHEIRIVPRVDDPENPFIELLFYYDFPKRQYLSPATYGNPDPVMELSEELMSNGNREDWILGKKLQPKMRTFVPVLVRGQESEGVKYWGFGKTVYEELLAIIDDPEYGDITDLRTGTDIIIEFTSPKDAGNDYGKITIRPKRTSTPATDKKEIVELIKNQVPAREIWTEASYDELKSALEKYLEPGEDVAEEAPKSNNDSLKDLFGGDSEAESVSDTTSNKAKLTEQAKTISKQSESVESSLDDIFGS